MINHITKVALIVFCGIILSACAGSIDPGERAPDTCIGIDAEVKKHAERIGMVAKLGKARDISVGAASVGTVTLPPPFNALAALFVTTASAADIDTTGEEERIRRLWDARDRRQVAGFEGC